MEYSKNERKITLPVVNLKLAGITVKSLLDSGASATLLNSKIFKMIQKDDRVKILKIDAQIKSVTDGKLEITNCISVPINIGNKHYQHKCYVVNNPLSDYYDAIIGYDFLKSKQFTICFKTDKIKMQNTEIDIHDALTNPVINQTTYAYLPKHIVLQAGESKDIEFALNKTVKKGDLIKIFSNLKNPNIKFVNMCRVDNERRIKVNVSNLSEKPIPLNKNTKIGTISNNYDTRNIELIKQLRRNELKPSDFNLEHLDEKIKKPLLDLLFEFADIFSKRLYTIGRTEAIQPTLEVDATKLPSIKPYRLPEALQKEANRQLEELEQANIIERSNSYISSPLLLVKKKNITGDPKDQKYRLVVNYRELNTHIKYPRYRLPIIQHLLDKLKGNKIYTTLDLSNSFFQIPLKVEHRDYTTFSTPKGNFRFVTLPQGLKISSEHFAMLTDQILSPLSELNISNFIDDFAMGSSSAAEMLHKLRLLFERFRLFGITLNPEKCSFMLPEINFLGHKLNADGIKPVEENIIKITDFPPPNTVKKIRRFVGLVSYYRKFIKDFSKLTAPLTDLTKRNARFKWNKEAQTSFDKLKEYLSQPPILIHPDFDKDFVLSADASDNTLGGWLGQEDANGIIRPIAYFSKKLNPTQRRYTILEKELMAIVCCISTFKHYLYGRHFIIRCDNKSLTQLSKLENPGNRVARWFMFLADYNYTFQHVPSSENIIADILSRDYFNTSEVNANTPIKSNTGSNNKNKTQEIGKILSNLNNNNNTECVTTKNCDSEKKTRTNQHYKESNTVKTIKGLENLGNSCFMNVVLQSLTHLSQLTNYLSHDTIDCDIKQNCMICSLKRHLQATVTSAEKVIKPVELYENLNKIGTQFRQNEQADAHEFLCQVICRLQESIKKHTNQDTINDNNASPIKSIFEGNFRSEVKCLNCKKKSINFEPFMDISLDIAQNSESLEDSLQNFTNPEYLTGYYRCFNCKIASEASKMMSISKNPEILTIHFKRFEFANSRENKLSSFISYPEKLNLRKYMSNVRNKKPIWYELHTVIVHSGNLISEGHYHSYVKGENGNWYLTDDTKIKRVNICEVLRQQAYILIYTIAGKDNNMSNLNLRIINAIQIDLPSINEIKLAQKEDKKLSIIITALQNGVKNDKQRFPDYFIRDDLLLHKASLPRIRKSIKVEQIVIPDKFKPHILTAKHISHFGLIKTYNAIRENYFWENLYSDTKHFIKSCKQCAAYRSPNKLPPIPIQRSYIPSQVNEFISADYIGPFPKTDKGNQYILTFLDHFSKYMKLYAVPKSNTYYSVECLMDFISTFGVPKHYLTDKQSCFTSEVFKHLCEKFGVTKLFTTPQHPSGNGASEKINANIKKSLAIFAEDTGQWDEYIGYYSLIYNNSVHSSHGEKPAYIQYSYDQQLPNDILREQQPIEHISYANFVRKKASQLNYVHNKVKENLLKSATLQEIYQHKKARHRNFTPGQQVFLHNRDCDRFKLTTKKRNNVGPYTIKEKHNEVNFTIYDPTDLNGKEMKVHSQRLIPFTQRRQELDLFNTKVKANSSPTSHTSEQTDKPNAQFDDLPNIHLLWEPNSLKPATGTIQSIQSEGSIMDDIHPLSDHEQASPISATSGMSHISSTHSSSTDDTIIYTPPRENISQCQRYDLRPIEPRFLANRFMQWALDVTKD